MSIYPDPTIGDVLTAAVPVVVAETRDLIAREIEAQLLNSCDCLPCLEHQRTVRRAAQIARGRQPVAHAVTDTTVTLTAAQVDEWRAEHWPERPHHG